jgi:hypothetical protein
MAGQTPTPGANDVGKTSGGGSLGHHQPDKVTRDGPIRNDPTHRDDDRAGERGHEPSSDPVMPADDSTLNTRI